MKKTRKMVVLIGCAVLLVCISVGATLAYLTSTETVTNTFTVGNVKIKLDEAEVDEYGVETQSAARVQTNEYKLLPGHTYVKDPTVTVLEGSEDCYVRMKVTISKIDALEDLVEKYELEIWDLIMGGDGDVWEVVGSEVNEGDARTYEIRCKNIVKALSGDVVLGPIFTKLYMPSKFTNEDLATIQGMTITVVADAIQADVFANADAAWNAFAPAP